MLPPRAGNARVLQQALDLPRWQDPLQGAGDSHRNAGGKLAAVRLRFPGRDHFTSYNGTTPVEVSSGNRKVHRLPLRGNRRINQAIHMAAITQLRHKHSEGRAYYDKKVAEGKTHKEALRSLKRKISDAIFARLQADARQASAKGPGGQPGNDSDSSAASSHPERQLFGPATPGPDTTIRPGTTTDTPSSPKPAPKKTRRTT